MVDYKLRLGDGTTFSVDEKGLNTWLQGGLVDDKARVQPAGSKKWFSLKQVLAAQGAQRGHAERQTEKGRADVDRQAAEEVAAIEKRVAEQRAAEERKAAEEVAAAERKAAEERTAAERKLIEEREAAKRRAEEEKAAAEARAAAERQAELDRVEAERKAAEDRAAAERAEAEAREAARVAEAERQVAAERAERAERKRKAEEARLEAEQRAAEEARLAAERKAAEDLAKERKAAEERAAAERKAAEAKEAAARRETEAREAAAREAARVAEAERAVAAERAERAERKRRAEEERLAEQRAAEERAAAERAARERDAAMDAFHVSDLAEPPATAITLDAEPAPSGFAIDAEPAPTGFSMEEERPSGFGAAEEPPATEIAIEPPATMVKVEDFERELGLKPVTFADGTGAPTERELSIAVREDRDRPRAADRPDSVFEGEEPSRPAVKTPAALDNAVMGFVKVLDRGVVWVVKTLAPLAGDLIARTVRSLKAAVPKLKGLLARRASSPPPSGDAPAAAPPVAPAPWSEPAPTPAPVAAPTPPPAPRAAPAAPPPWAAPIPEAAKAPVALKAQAPPKAQEVPPKPATPPPSYQKLDVIPFAAAPTGPKVEEEVWDGEDAWQEPSAVSTMFSTLWLWVKRVTIVTALVVTAALLYLNKEKWLPGAKSAAVVLGQQVDELSERASTRTVPPEAVAAAQAEVPYLRAQTIEQIMLQSTEGVLEPAEVFRRAHVAFERARPSLPNQVVAEIDHHTGAVVAGLDPLEAEQLRRYLADLHAGTPTAAYQDKGAVWLMARGARRLPADRIARMQELFAQAVTPAFQPSPRP